MRAATSAFHVKRATPPSPLSPRAFQAMTGCSDAALARLAAYLDLLAHWQRRINLVGTSTLADPWRRHVLDSQQLVPLLPPGAPAVTDLGSGAGFPGLVIALLAGAAVVTLVEADQRKAAFLAAAARATDAAICLEVRRMETLPAASADVVTARACAPLPRLLPTIARILRPGGVALLLKGQTGKAELTRAEKDWTMRTTVIGSVTEPAGVVLQLQDLQAAP